MPDMDPETHKIMTDAEEIRAMTDGKGWTIVESKLKNRILDLQNINNIDVSTIDTIAQQIAARKMASDLVYEWLKLDVHGAIEAKDASTPPAGAQAEDFMERG